MSVGRPFRAVQVGLERPTYGYLISCRVPANERAWRAWAALVAAAGLSAVIAGCSYEPAPPKPSSSNTTGAAPPAATPGAKLPLPSSASAAAIPPIVPTVTPAAPAAAARPVTYPVQLSAGVALPQTTVEGTKMGFSVDYQLSGSGASPMAAFWVIQRDRGSAARISVRLQAGGNLATFLDWPPDEGPYQCRIVDSAGQPLSADTSMR